MRCRSNNATIVPASGERGGAALIVVVILVPVLFAFIGFAVDLGILYSIRGELKAGANSMALAAAQKLIGTDSSGDAAAAAAQLAIENSSGFGNRYYFQGLAIGETAGSVSSTVSEPALYATAVDAIASSAADAGGAVGGSQARYARVTVTGQTQVLFWSFLPIVSDRRVTVAASAVAGISSPLCVACGIEPFAVAALNQSDTTDFGFTPGTKYSFAYLCTTPPPGSAPVLPGGAQQISYLLLNRFDSAATVLADEDSQAFRQGAGGLPASTNTAQACFQVNNTEAIWASATPRACAMAQVAPVVTAALCGLSTRFDSAMPAACSNIAGVDLLTTAFQPDADIEDHDLYSDYTGDGRRLISIPIVDTLNTASMTILGFRQFLVMPNQGAANINPADNYGRFLAIYAGSVAPLKQGRFDGCQQTAGPGKVVLYQ